MYHDGLNRQARNPVRLPDGSGDLASAGGIAGDDITDHRRQVGTPRDVTLADGGRGYHDCVECEDGKRDCTCGAPRPEREKAPLPAGIEDTPELRERIQRDLTHPERGYIA